MFRQRHPILFLVLPHIHKNFIYRNTASLFPYRYPPIEDRINLIKDDVDEQALLLFLYMTIYTEDPRNLGSILKTLISMNKIKHKTLLGNFSEKIFDDIIASDDDAAAVEVLKGFSDKNHILDRHSLEMMNKCIAILDTKSTKKKACKYILKTLYTHTWEKLQSTDLSELINSIQVLLSRLSEEEQQKLVIESLQKAEIFVTHYQLKPFLKATLKKMPNSGKDIYNMVQAIAFSGNLYTQKEKIALIRKLIKKAEELQFYNKMTVSNLYHAIIRANLTELYPEISKLVLRGKKDWRNYESIINLCNLIIDQHPNVHKELHNFLLKALSALYSFTVIEDMGYDRTPQLIQKIVEKNYHELYPTIDKFFIETVNNADKLSESDEQEVTKIITFMINHHVKDPTLQKEKKFLIDGVIGAFWQIGLANELPERIIVPVLTLIESLSTPDFNSSVRALKNMLEEAKKQGKEVGEIEKLIKKIIEE